MQETQTPDSIRDVAFIGTGLMGVPMVYRLLGAGLAVRVWNRTSNKLEPLLAAGAVRAASPAEAAQGADLVCLCLANASAIETVLFGESGVAAARNPAPLLVDFSTIGPDRTLEFAERLRVRRRIAWVDAPVSGGATGAAQGKLVIFCGGSTADIDRLAPLFAALAQRITRVGELGSGQTLKLCNQLIVASNLVAIAEALTLAEENGLDPGILPDALTGGFADSIPLQIFGRRMAAHVTDPKLGELALMLKDLTAVEALARARRVQLPLAAAALRVYGQAADEGVIQEDLSALISLYERQIARSRAGAVSPPSRNPE
jgi:3-hydroxyisobutyrate dehydrogenase-like beta-hydroxyacid dehydrogenase